MKLKNIIIALIFAIAITILTFVILFFTEVISFNHNEKVDLVVHNAQKFVNSLELDLFVDRIYSEIEHSNDMYGKDLLKSESYRALLVYLSIPDLFINHTDDMEIVQSDAYITYDVFAGKYRELFNVDFKYMENQLYADGNFANSVTTVNYEKCKTNDLNNCFYRWNNVYMQTNYYDLVVTSVDNRVIHGELYRFFNGNNAITFNNNEEKIGTFELRYIYSNGNYYIDSFAINN